jgi:hypothetical protein
MNYVQICNRRLLKKLKFGKLKIDVVVNDDRHTERGRERVWGLRCVCVHIDSARAFIALMCCGISKKEASQSKNNVSWTMFIYAIVA